MKTFVSLYIVIILFFISVVPASFGGTGGGLYAQDPEIFEHTWYLEKINVDNEEFHLTDYYTAEPAITEFDEVSNTLFISMCEFNCFWASTDFDTEAALFELSNFDECVLTGECLEPGSNLYFFRDLYFSIYNLFDTSQTFNNPFTYTIEAVDDHYQLTIENVEGDWAVYNSVLLSTSTFHQNSFTLYPNPVKEVLRINNFSSSELVTASIYNINGKKIQTHSFENNVSTIDVKALNPGLYFVVFESETGERVSKRISKQ